jgi:uncharacterized membrane protein YccC
MIDAPSRGRTRASRLLADLVVFDPARFAWRLGLRTTVGMLVPLILGRALGLPELYLVGLAAYLLASPTRRTTPTICKYGGLRVAPSSAAWR